MTLRIYTIFIYCDFSCWVETRWRETTGKCVNNCVECWEWNHELTEVFQRSLLLVLLGRLSVHQVVETGAALHEVVETTHDSEDTEREDPDTDDSNNAGPLVVLEPTKDTEEGGKDIDEEDSTAELPRGDRRPERTVGTGDEDEPVLGKRDLKEENLVDVTEVLDNTAVLSTSVHGGEGNPGTDSQNNTKQDGHTPELGEVPLDGSRGVRSVVVGDSKGSNISKDGWKLLVQRSRDAKVKDLPMKTTSSIFKLRFRIAIQRPRKISM